MNKSFSCGGAGIDRSRGAFVRRCIQHIIHSVLSLSLVLFWQSAATAGVKVGDVNASVQPTPSMIAASGSYGEGTCHGYVEFRVLLRNNSPEERIVHLSYPPSRSIHGGVVVQRTVKIAGKQTVSVSIFQPPLYASSNTLEVRVKGVRDPGIIQINSTFSSSVDYGFSSNETSKVAVLLDRAIPQEFADGMKAEKTTVGTTAGGTITTTVTSSEERFTYFRSELPVGEWSRNWLGYSCFDVIVIDGGEAESMPPQVSLAVRRWLECGGTLIVNSRTMPEALCNGGRLDSKKRFRVGLGRVILSMGEGKDGWKKTYKLLAGTSIPVYNPIEAPNQTTQHSQSLVRHRPNAEQTNLLIAQTTVPIRGLFVLVLLFGICIGPANLWLLSRYKRRIWLWWNVPAISLLTCTLVFGYSIASEGWTPRGKTAGLTILDERAHRATTVGYVSFYSPLTPSSGPRFHADTEVTLLATEIDPWRGYRTVGSDSIRFVDWTADQHLLSGWVNARVPTYFQIRKNEDRRERLTVEKNADGTLKIVNALGADIRRLCLADSSGRIFEANDIPAGAERTLKADEKKTASIKGDFVSDRISLVSNWLHTFRGINNAKDLSGSVSPGTYIALLDSSPFIEKPLDGAEVEDTATIVYGISKEE